MLVDVTVVPRASRDKVELLADGRLKVWVTSPPVDGAANDAVVKLIAKGLGLRGAEVRVVRGLTSRKKTVEVLGVASLAELAIRLAPP